MSIKHFIHARQPRCCLQMLGISCCGNVLRACHAQRRPLAPRQPADRLRRGHMWIDLQRMALQMSRASCSLASCTRLSFYDCPRSRDPLLGVFFMHVHVTDDLIDTSTSESMPAGG